MAGQCVSINGHSGQAMAGSSIMGDIGPPCIQSGTNTSTKSRNKDPRAPFVPHIEILAFLVGPCLWQAHQWQLIP